MMKFKRLKRISGSQEIRIEDNRISEYQDGEMGFGIT